MAQLDVSELMTDPTFVDPILIIHRRPTVNEMGENTLTRRTVPSIGSVQPASGNVLARLPDSFRDSDVSSFWVKGVIIADGRSQYPDVLVFKNEEYEVQQVMDWSNFGQGYSEGICIRKKISL
jgi:galactose-6-phosphate isomerase